MIGAALRVVTVLPAVLVFDADGLAVVHHVRAARRATVGPVVIRETFSVESTDPRGSVEEDPWPRPR